VQNSRPLMLLESNMGTETTENAQILIDKNLIKVLLVEDDAVDIRLVERILAKSSQPVKFAVESAESLSAASECMVNREYNVILLDLELPDSSGIETVQKIHEVNPHIPILVLTGVGDEEMGRSALKNGATDYLVKDLPLNVLLVRTIIYALEREKEKKLILDANRQLQETSQKLFSAKQDLEKKNQALEKAQEELEKRIEERTAELAKANKTLQATEVNLRNVIRQNADGIVIVDNDGTVRFVNPAVCSLFSRKPEEFIGENFGFPIAVGEATEIDVIHKDGKPIVAEMRVAEVEWEGESVKLISIRDITEYKCAKEQIEHAAKEWRTTFDSIADMISIHDKKCKITLVNKALADAFKKEPKELISKTCHELFHGTKQPYPNCPHMRSLKTQKPATLELFEPRLGIHLGVSTSPIFDEKGEVIGSVHIAKDITERKHAEETLKKANEKLTEYNRLKDEFVSTASHELRTPLSIIQGAIRLILDEIPGKIVEEQRDVLATAMENVKRLGRIVDSLLNISRIESGKLDLQKTVVDICKLIKDTVSEYKALAEEKELSLDYEVPEVGIDVCLNPDKIKEVLTNLISNSLKFTPEGGWVKVVCNEQDREVQICVQDSGVGIARQDIPKLFDKFTQFGRKAGPGEKGTGLGLAIAKKLVEMHSGKIEVQSEVDQGTTFTVSLPLTTEVSIENLPSETDELVENTLNMGEKWIRKKY